MIARFFSASSVLRNFISLLLFILALAGCEKEPEPVRISSFEPTSGDYESQVTIAGSHFETQLENNTVKFGGKAAEIISGTQNELVVAVPVGAVTGKITVEAGGQTVTSNENFTVNAGSWARMADLNKAVDNASLFFTVGNNAYLHIRWSTLNGNFVPASFWMYSPSANSWVQKKELDINQDAIGAKFWGTSDKGYILQYQKLWEYNLATNQWVLKSTLPPALNTDNVAAVFYVSSVNKAYAVMSNGIWFSYDPVNDIWGQNQNTAFTTEVAAATGVFRGQGVADKGFFMKGKTVWEFNPVINQWSQLPPSPESENDFSFGINNELYVGYAFDEYTNNFWVFKKDQNKWIRKAVLPGSRSGVIYFTVNNKGYLGLGVKYPQGYYTYDFNEFTP